MLLGLHNVGDMYLNYNPEYCADYIDEYIEEVVKGNFLRIYPEFPCYVVGVTNDRTKILIASDMPDGTWYFACDETTISRGYQTKDEAERD